MIITETGTTTTADLNKNQLTNEKYLAEYGKEILKLVNHVNRTKDADGERLSERVLKEKHNAQCKFPILENVILRDYLEVVKANREIERIKCGVAQVSHQPLGPPEPEQEGTLN